jgi:hypothetical protein
MEISLNSVGIDPVSQTVDFTSVTTLRRLSLINTRLTTVSGFRALTCADLYIVSNLILPTCSAQALAAQITCTGPTVEIRDNLHDSCSPPPDAGGM